MTDSRLAGLVSSRFLAAPLSGPQNCRKLEDGTPYSELRSLKQAKVLCIDLWLGPAGMQLSHINTDLQRKRMLQQQAPMPAMQTTMHHKQAGSPVETHLDMFAFPDTAACLQRHVTSS